MIALTLPYPPTVNTYYGNGPRGNVYIKPAGRSYRLKVMALMGRYKSNTTERLQVFVAVNPPDKRKRDLDNVCKATLDALQHAGCFKDDNQIDDLRIVRRKPVKGGSIQVQISVLRVNDENSNVEAP